MHEHVSINGLWCSRELVQSLGWCVLHPWHPAHSPGAARLCTGALLTLLLLLHRSSGVLWAPWPWNASLNLCLLSLGRDGGNCSEMFLSFRGVSPCCWFQHSPVGWAGNSCWECSLCHAGAAAVQCWQQAQGTTNTMLGARFVSLWGAVKPGLSSLSP